ncbi:MAG: branched-chain amino acid ABC transporter permease [Bacillota bacterium]
MKNLRTFWTYFAILAVCLILPVIISDPYYHSVLVTTAIFVILALSMDIIVGYIGELSLGHAAFFGLGAYVSAILTKNLHYSFWAGFLAAIVIAGAAGYIIGFITLRLKGAYFAIVTLAFAEILRLVASNWINLTRGPMGIPGIPFPKLFGWELSSGLVYFYLVLFFVLLSVILIIRLVNSPAGRAFLAAREHEDLARSVGINTYQFKVLGFTIATMMAAAAGSLYAHFFRFVGPDLLGIYYTSTPLLMVFIGGRASIAGPLVGAVIFSVLPEFLRMAGSLRMVIFALVLIVSVIFMPQGIIRALGNLRRRKKEDGLTQTEYAG